MDKNRKNTKEFTHIGDILQKTLKSARQENADIELIKIWDIWDDIVGPGIFENAKPAAFKGKLLIVHVNSSVYIQDLLFRKDMIIEIINEALNKKLVEDIQFKVGEL